MAVKKVKDNAVAKTDEQKPKRKRPDKTEMMSVHTDPGDNRKYLEHSLKMWNWPQVHLDDPLEVQERVGMYFSLCEEDDMKPTVSGLGLALGYDRRRLWEIVNNITDHTASLVPETRDVIKKAYQILTVQMENYMQNGKINPVAGIFLMKNNMDYKDKQEVIVKPADPMGEGTNPIELQQKYIDSADAGLIED